MPRKSKLTKAIEEVVEKPPAKTFQPYTWIRCERDDTWGDIKLTKNRRYLFLGWITNPQFCGDTAVLMDDCGPFTCSIREEDFEVCR